MAKTYKITFKKRPRETGLAAVGHPHAWMDIKYKGQEIGYVMPRSWSIKNWRLFFRVNGPSGWGWHEIPHKFNSEQEVRDWVAENTETILAMDLASDDDP